MPTDPAVLAQLSADERRLIEVFARLTTARPAGAPTPRKTFSP